MHLQTALQHFREDIQRARNLHAHAAAMAADRLRDDILRAAWMMSVGACDAYFSDAYADLLARTLRAKDIEPQVQIPDRLNNLKLPVVALIRQSRGGWRWRMAARELMESENVLSFEKVRGLFNHFFRKKHKILNTDTIDSWILHASAKQRFFGISKAAYRRTNGSGRSAAKDAALAHFAERFDAIFQRRHDCIHNCDRPKVALQAISPNAVRNTIEEVDFLVARFHESTCAEFHHYLRALGFSGATRARVCL